MDKKRIPLAPGEIRGMINKTHPKGETEMLEEIREQAARAVQELCEIAGLGKKICW